MQNTTTTRCEAHDGIGDCFGGTYTEVADASPLVTRTACANHVNISRGWHATIVGRVTRNHPVVMV